MCVSSSSWLTSGKPPPVAYACDPCDPVTISAKNRLCLQPVMISGMSCVCAELGGSGKLAGDHGGNVEPRVAAAWMQGRSTLQATDAQLCAVCDWRITGHCSCALRGCNVCSAAMSGFMAWSCLRLVCVAATLVASFSFGPVMACLPLRLRLPPLFLDFGET